MIPTQIIDSEFSNPVEPIIWVRFDDGEWFLPPNPYTEVKKIKSLFLEVSTFEEFKDKLRNLMED